MPSREEINAAYLQGEGATVACVAASPAQVGANRLCQPPGIVSNSNSYSKFQPELSQSR